MSHFLKLQPLLPIDILLRGGGHLELVLGVGALEVFDAEGGWAALEVPDAGGDLVDEVEVVGDEEDGAFVLLQREVEGVDGFEVEMVGRLVEDEDVGLLQHELAEEQAGGFAAGERVGHLHALFAAEEHLAEDAADVFLGGILVELVQPVVDGASHLDGGDEVLREVADLRSVAPLDGA